ncbi:hypothetical protein DQ354_18675 [Arthrobacter sp. AQ5-06]|nr:hypothetical protein DQ354_18675 [Arthrobacter sp. AQ5-06]
MFWLEYPSAVQPRTKVLVILPQRPEMIRGRERQAREDFELSGVRFWQEVNRLASQPEAYAWDPHIIGQLIDRRVQRDRPRLTMRIICWPG